MESILAGERLFFVEEQLGDEITLGRLEKAAKELGATIAESRADEPTAIIVNPASPEYEPEQGSTTPSIPYHWIAICKYAETRIDPDDIEPKVPYIVNEFIQSKLGNPLRVYVSLNIERNLNRRPAEEAAEARADAESKLARGGAIIVQQRKLADLIIFNRQTDFYETIMKEIKEHNRTWQRTAERVWVNEVAALGKMLSLSVGEVEKLEREEREDSFAAEEKIDRAGPGRPTGKPRNEYTPEDDEFLCRYLAYWHPTTAASSRAGDKASRGSRKTYQIMAERASKYPLVERHSYQSWHERYKKNERALEKRSWRFQEAGIDEDLKTDDERAKARRIAREAESEETADGDRGSGAAVSAAQPTKRRSLVDLDADTEVPPLQLSPKATQGTALGRAARIEAASGGEGSRTDAGDGIRQKTAATVGEAEPSVPSSSKLLQVPSFHEAEAPGPAEPQSAQVVAAELEQRGELSASSSEQPVAHEAPASSSGEPEEDARWYWDPPTKTWRHWGQVGSPPEFPTRTTEDMRGTAMWQYIASDDLWQQMSSPEEEASSAQAAKPVKRTARKGIRQRSPLKRPPSTNTAEASAAPSDVDSTVVSIAASGATSPSAGVETVQLEMEVSQALPVEPEQPPDTQPAEQSAARVQMTQESSHDGTATDPSQTSEPDVEERQVAIVVEEQVTRSVAVEEQAARSTIVEDQVTETVVVEEQVPVLPAPPAQQPLFMPSPTPPSDYPAPAPAPMRWDTPEAKPSITPAITPAPDAVTPLPKRPRATEPLVASRILVPQARRSSEPRKKRARLSLAEEIEHAAHRTPTKRSRYDTVAASATVPPPVARKSVPITPQQPTPSRPPSPPLSRQEYAERVRSGQELVQKKKEEYIYHTRRLAEMFNIGPRQVFEAIQQLGGGSRGATYWDDCEAALRERYG